MKKIKIVYVALLLVLGVSWTSCSDYFDVDANGLPVEDYARNREDLNAGAIGIYAALSQEVHNFLLWGSARADLVTSGSTSNLYVNEFVNNTVTDLNPHTNYSGLYKVISRVNVQLETIEKVRKLDHSLDDDDISAFYGEAYYLRAVAYFYLVRTFKEVPLLVDHIAENLTFTNEAGEVISLKTLDLSDDDLRKIALKPAEEQAVWMQIQADLLRAMGMLRPNYQWNGKDISDLDKKARASLGGAYALAAEVEVWLQDFEKASAYAHLVKSNTTLYGVSESSTWGSQFTLQVAGKHGISILAYNYPKSLETNRLQEFTSHLSTHGGKYYLKPAKRVVDDLFFDGADNRFQSTYKRFGTNDLIWKYISIDNQVAMREPYESDATWHLMRTADVFLMKAIADNRLNRHGAVLWYYNQVRTASNLDPIEIEDLLLMSMTEIEDMILEERARELAFEGKRWYDLLLVSKVFGRSEVLPTAISKKYPIEERAAAFTHLSNEEIWFLPVDPQRWK